MSPNEFFEHDFIKDKKEIESIQIFLTQFWEQNFDSKKKFQRHLVGQKKEFQKQFWC